MSDMDYRNDALRDDHRSDDQKSPERLEQEANQARARLERTVDELSNRLSPGEMLDQGLRMIRDNGGEFGRNLGNQMKQNPLPLVITAIGISWLMFGSGTRDTDGRRTNSSRSYDAGTGDIFRDASSVVPTQTSNNEPGIVDRMKGAASDAKDSVTGAVEDAKHGIGDAVDSATSAVKGAAARVGDMADSARQSTSEIRNRVTETAASTRDTFAHLLDEQPLLVGGLGIAIGAALGAMLPSTDAENRLMGETSSRMTSKAKNVAREQYDHVKDTVMDVADEMSNIGR